MSGGAKLHILNGYWPLLIALHICKQEQKGVVTSGQCLLLNKPPKLGVYDVDCPSTYIGIAVFIIMCGITMRNISIKEEALNKILQDIYLAKINVINFNVSYNHTPSFNILGFCPASDDTYLLLIWEPRQFQALYHAFVRRLATSPSLSLGWPW